VAADGFVRFRDALVVASAGAPKAEQFERAALAYLAFGRANRGVYRLMFASSVLKTSEDGALAETSIASFQFLLDALAPHAPADRLQAVAVWVWSTLHGLVLLEAEGLAGGPFGEPASPACVVREMISTLTRPTA
jgi:hypothetical protein